MLDIDKPEAGRPAWSVLPFALLIIVPLGVILSGFLSPQPQAWDHLLRYELARVLSNTFVLMAGVALGVLLLGIGLAWLTAVCDFPGRRFFSWALMLPMAIPAYVLAFVHVALLDYSGPVQSTLRLWWGGPVWFPSIRSTWGVVLVMTLALYPYVYLLSRQAFLTQGQRMLEAAQTLGMGHRRAFWKVALPMSRPWWVAGLTLVLMETLADFGTVSIFNFDTFTTAIYKAWFALFNLPLASQLSSLLLMLVMGLVWAERCARGRRAYAGRLGAGERIVLRGAARWVAAGSCSIILLMAFGVPFVQVLAWVTHVWREDLDARYASFVGHSILLAVLAATVVVLSAIWLAFVQRLHKDSVTRSLTALATGGYAVPGIVLAVGVYIPVAWLDNQMADLLARWGLQPAFLLGGSMAVMLIGLASRFLAVGFGPVDAGMRRITVHQENAARSLGLSPRETLARLHLPILRGSVFSAALLVFVDVLKEIPITLMTRPFGWDTLSVRIFEMTSEGMWERAALPALFIVLVGLLPVFFLTRDSES